MAALKVNQEKVNSGDVSPKRERRKEEVAVLPESAVASSIFITFFYKDNIVLKALSTA